MAMRARSGLIRPLTTPDFLGGIWYYNGRYAMRFLHSSASVADQINIKSSDAAEMDNDWGTTMSPGLSFLLMNS